MLLGDFSSGRVYKSGIAALLWCGFSVACRPQPLLKLDRQVGLSLQGSGVVLQASDDIEPFELGAMQEAG